MVQFDLPGNSSALAKIHTNYYCEFGKWKKYNFPLNEKDDDNKFLFSYYIFKLNGE